MAITWDKVMASSKHFNKIAWAVTALILAVAILLMNGGNLGLEVKAHTMGYEDRLFDNTRVHTIDIVMDDWDEFIDHAPSEEYYIATVVIDGEAFKNVGIRGKGNTSLSTVSSMNSDRYSLKVEFDQYDSSLTYHGLDKLNLNNLIQDSTMMKDYLTYTMMNEFGVHAPLCSYVYMTVNGEDWGLYLAVEGVEDAFLRRNYGSDYGELYKPDSMSFGGGRGNGRNFNMDDFLNREDLSEGFGESNEGIPIPQMPNMEDFDPSQMQGGFGGNMPPTPGMKNGFNPEMPDMGGFGGMGASDVKLQYIDDNADSYSNIWTNAKTDITNADKRRLIESLKKLSNQEEIESVVDIEQVIRYFVVHNFVCNGDSYTGSMTHNYYLYEKDGQMAMIPWDYNLAFGTFLGGNAQSTVNTPIDSPVDRGSGEDRPMWNWIAAGEEYTELYHQYFADFLNTVDIAGIIDRTYDLIKSYVEKDPTAFYSYEDFENGVETLRQFCSLRTESITAQLANGETTETKSYADASNLTLSLMGTMNMGGGFGGGMPDMPGTKDGFNGQMPNMGEMPEGFDPFQIPGGISGQMPELLEQGDSADDPKGDSEPTEGDSQMSGEIIRPSRDNLPMPGGEFNFGMSDMAIPSTNTSSWIWVAVSVLILCAGLVVAMTYKR